MIGGDLCLLANVFPGFHISGIFSDIHSFIMFFIQLLNYRGRIQWWQSKTVSTAPVAGWTSSAGEGRTTSAGPFSPWTQWDCPTSGPEKLCCPGIWMTPLQSQCCSWWWLGGGHKLQVVKTAPDSQLLNLLFVSRLVTALNEADQCGVVCSPILTASSTDLFALQANCRGSSKGPVEAFR